MINMALLLGWCNFKDEDMLRSWSDIAQWQANVRLRALAAPTMTRIQKMLIVPYLATVSDLSHDLHCVKRRYFGPVVSAHKFVDIQKWTPSPRLVHSSFPPNIVLYVKRWVWQPDGGNLREIHVYVRRNPENARMSAVVLPDSKVADDYAATTVSAPLLSSFCCFTIPAPTGSLLLNPVLDLSLWLDSFKSGDAGCIYVSMVSRDGVAGPWSDELSFLTSRFKNNGPFDSLPTFVAPLLFSSSSSSSFDSFPTSPRLETQETIRFSWCSFLDYF